MLSRAGAAARGVAGALWLPPLLLCVLAWAWFGVRCVHGFTFLSFADESGHLVGARAIHAGDRLYREFVDAHGPLVFMVAHTYGVLFGWREPLDARRAIAALAFGADACVFFSPVFRSLAERLWGAGLFAGLLAAPWLVQALDMVNYHVLGGLMVAVALAFLVVPAWQGAAIARWQAFVAGVCLVWLCACAYALAPSAFLLWASAACFIWPGADPAYRRGVMVWVALGFLGGGLVVLAWLLVHGDVVGYLVFHFISNQFYYSQYSSFGWGAAAGSLVPSLAADRLVQSAATFAASTGLVVCIWLNRTQFRRHAVMQVFGIVLLVAALVMLNFRGASTFQDGSFVVASVALLSVALARAVPRAGTMGARRAWIITACLGLLVCGVEAGARAAITSPFQAKWRDYQKWPKTYLAVNRATPTFARLHDVMRPGERLLVLVYNPDFFLPAGVLPVAKYHGYLPWEADYARHPWFGREFDLCKDTLANPPPAIVYDGWKVWDAYDPNIYIACIPALLKKDYVLDAVPYLYVRKDRAGRGVSGRAQ